MTVSPAGPSNPRTRMLILGATGMLGHALMRQLSTADELTVYSSARDADPLRGSFPAWLRERVVPDVDVRDAVSVQRLLNDVRPDVVVNCVGIVKQDPRVADVITTITVNSLLPHLLSRECANRGARLIHVSTDCVFSGERGGARETDHPDPRDLYGRSKLMGEVTDPPALTLRTSIVGHELRGHRSLVDWFLAQDGVVCGYTKAIYSGITTVEFARLLRSVVIPRPSLVGLYHVASTPISKDALLRLIARQYGWPGRIEPYTGVVCDRSLRADAFLARTGYRPPPWPQMIAEMWRNRPAGLSTPGDVAVSV